MGKRALVVFVALAGLVLFAQTSKADVILTAEKILELDAGETWGTFEKWVIHAVGDAGETINVFTGLNIDAKDDGMGIHQVWAPPGGFGGSNPTPLQSDHGFGPGNAFDWDDSWNVWDSFFHFDDDDFALVAGSSVFETNDLSTEGDLGLPGGDQGSLTADSGFGTIGQGSTGSYTISNGSDDVDFLCVVVKQGDDILLDITIGGVLADNQTGFEKDFTDFMLVPEPSAVVLASLALMGMFGLIRRRGKGLPNRPPDASG